MRTKRAADGHLIAGFTILFSSSLESVVPKPRYG